MFRRNRSAWLSALAWLGLSLPATLWAQTSLSVLSSQLGAETSQLSQNIQFELRGTALGRNLQSQADQLQAAAAAYDREVKRFPTYPPAQQQALGAVEQAHWDLVSLLASLPVSAPRTASSVGQINRLVEQIRGAGGGFGGSGGSGGGGFGGSGGNRPPGMLGFDGNRIGREIETLQTRLNQVIQQIQRENAARPPYDGIVIRLSGLQVSLNQFVASMAGSPRLEFLQRSWIAIRYEAQGAGETLSAARPGVAVQRLWESAWWTIDMVTVGLGLPTNFMPPTPVLPPAPNVIGPLDQAVAEVDGFLSALRPSLNTIPEGPAFESDARTLKADLLGLRQRIAGNASGPELERAMRSVEGSHQRLEARLIRVSRGTVGPNIARIRRVGTLITQIRDLLERG